MSFATKCLGSILILSSSSLACGSKQDSGDGLGGVGSSSSSGGTGTGAVAGGNAGSFSLGGSAVAAGGTGTVEPGGACQAVTAGATVQPVFLVFAFDVSGSMGKGDAEWHDQSLKWDPIVAATKSFFADATSQGLSASLKFFPVEGGDDLSCNAATYATPDVPMTALPSAAFGAALDANTPQTEDDWIGGTPTAFAIRGTQEYIAAQQAAAPGRYVTVLVTDGYPQGCGGDADEIATVAADVASALSNDVETYVIGVANPPVNGAPDVVTNLQQIAVAGGTERAFLIDTGSPTATSAAFLAAIDEIRGAAISCSIDIPQAPDGRAFDKQRVRVTYTTGAASQSELVYDAGCAQPNSWRYDDPLSPKQLILCDASCETVRGDIAASLGIEFACEQVIEIPE